MSKKTIWDIFGGFLFAFSLAVLLRGTALPVMVPLIGAVPPEQVTVFGILFGAPVLILLTRFADKYRAAHRFEKPTLRLPPVFHDADGAEARWLGWAAFALGPALAQILFLREFMQHGYYHRFSSDAIDGGWMSVLTSYRPLTVLTGDIYRFHSPSGVTGFPFWQPWAYLLLISFAIGYFIRYAFRVFRSPMRKLSLSIPPEPRLARIDANG